MLEPMAKLWGVSDLHVEHAENWNWLAALPNALLADGLVVAGDMCTSMDKLRDAILMLVPKFKHGGQPEAWNGLSHPPERRAALVVHLHGGFPPPSAASPRAHSSHLSLSLPLVPLSLCASLSLALNVLASLLLRGQP